MKKYFIYFIHSCNGILIILAAIIGLCTWFYMSYTSPKNIQYSYNGIKYQAGNLKNSEPIEIEIKGKFTKKLFAEHGNYGEFDGSIKIGEKIFTDTKIGFSKDKMGSLESSEGMYGMIYTEGMLEKLTIEVLEPNGNGGYSWSGGNGWVISAPCSNRIEAVEILNMLRPKMQKIR